MQETPAYNCIRWRCTAQRSQHKTIETNASPWRPPKRPNPGTGHGAAAAAPWRHADGGGGVHDEVVRRGRRGRRQGACVCLRECYFVFLYNVATRTPNSFSPLSRGVHTYMRIHIHTQTLTHTRTCAQECRIWCYPDRNFLTAGVPVPRLHVYVRKLVAAGHKVQHSFELIALVLMVCCYWLEDWGCTRAKADCGGPRGVPARC